MTDQQRKYLEEAADNYVDKEVAYSGLEYSLAGNTYKKHIETFKAGADYWHARAKLLEATLIDTSNCNSCEKCSNAAREALTRYRDGGGAV